MYSSTPKQSVKEKVEPSIVVVIGDRQSGKDTYIERAQEPDDPFTFISLPIDEFSHQQVRTFPWSKIKAFVFLINIGDRQSILYLYRIIPLLLHVVCKVLPLCIIGNLKGFRKVSTETIRYIIPREFERQFPNLLYTEVDLLSNTDDSEQLIRNTKDWLKLKY